MGEDSVAAGARFLANRGNSSQAGREGCKRAGNRLYYRMEVWTSTIITATVILYSERKVTLQRVQILTQIYEADRRELINEDG